MNIANIEQVSVTGVVTPASAIWPVSLHPDLSIAVSGRTHGNTDRRFGSASIAHANRLALAGRVGCSELIVMAPFASDTFVDVDFPEDYEHLVVLNEDLSPEDTTGNMPLTDIKCDALVTTKKAAGLMLGAADCSSLVLYDPKVETLAHVHVGRPGAELNIASKVVTYLQDHKGVKSGRLLAHFGPAIKPESYVMPQRGQALQGPEWNPHIEATEDGFTVDFVGRAVAQLLEQNIEAHNITATDVDVGTDPEFFSLVKHKTTGAPIGRNGFVVAMNGPR